MLSIANPPYCWIIAGSSHHYQHAVYICDAMHSRPVIVSADQLHEDTDMRAVCQSAADQLGLNDTAVPDIVFGVTQETSRLLLRIGAEIPSALIVQLMAPADGISWTAFDMVIVPEHEPYPDIGEHVLRCIGLPQKVTKESLSEAKAIFYKEQPAFGGLPAPHIAVLLGGSHAGGDITPEDTFQLASKLNQLADTTEVSFWISSSARTRQDAISSLEYALKAPYYLYNWATDRDHGNPYMQFLAQATAIICSGDSVRMLSEACHSNKPVAIYTADKPRTHYGALHTLLYERGCAIPFASYERLLSFKPQILNENQRLANNILSRLNAKRR